MNYDCQTIIIENMKRVVLAVATRQCRVPFLFRSFEFLAYGRVFCRLSFCGLSFGSPSV